MVALCFLLRLLASLFKSKSRLEAENAALRQELIVLQRKVHGRIHFTNRDRLFFVQLYRWFPSILKAMKIFWTIRAVPPAASALGATKAPPGGAARIDMACGGQDRRMLGIRPKQREPLWQRSAVNGPNRMFAN